MLGNVGYRNFPTAFSPAALFAAAEPGVWYDPSDVANTLWVRNLLTFTEQFDNAIWIKNNFLAFGSGSVANTTATTDPLGGNTADLLVTAAATAATRVYQGINSNTGQVNTTTWYVKKQTGSAVRWLRFTADQTAVNTYFDLDNGVFGTVGAGITPFVISLPNGWYRVGITYTAAATDTSDNQFLNLANGNNMIASYIGDGTSGFYIWGAQTEIGSAPTEYQPITTVDAGTIARFPQATLYQDSVGTIPVTAPAQPVGRMLDKSGRGNNATQTTSGSRPTYGIVPATGRRNLLVQTEDFSNVAWEKTGTTISTNTNIAPDGTLTADTATATTTDPGLTQIISGTGLTYTFSIWLRGVGSSIGKMPTLFLIRDAFAQVLLSGTLPVLTGNWQRYTFTGTFSVAPTSQVRARVDYVDTSPVIGDAVNVWGAQLETGSTATAYQRVVTTFEVTEANVASLSYLSFDGIDDFMVTPTITPGTDKVQVFTGVRKLSDAAVGSVVESSVGSGNGRFQLSAPVTVAPNYGFTSVGTSASFAVSVTPTFVAPITNVITGTSDISADSAILRVNGTERATSSSDQGSGNYLANQLFIGRRGGTTLPFNGQMYGLITRFGSNLTTTAISRTESWMNSKTGAF